MKQWEWQLNAIVRCAYDQGQAIPSMPVQEPFHSTREDNSKNHLTQQGEITQESFNSTRVDNSIIFYSTREMTQKLFHSTRKDNSKNQYT